MHPVTITTCTPHGHHLSTVADVALGDDHDALRRAYALAATVTIDLHAQDTETEHVHLIAINSQPCAIIRARQGDQHRTDLLATLHQFQQHQP
ncbi:hypothetical protein GS921_24280 [Rhodococcus hoagii]|nr:hypothetical protein [Prescottella equi]NKV32826.1 hypothetical protein [Prescottella equi]